MLFILGFFSSPGPSSSSASSFPFRSHGIKLTTRLFRRVFCRCVGLFFPLGVRLHAVVRASIINHVLFLVSLDFLAPLQAHAIVPRLLCISDRFQDIELVLVLSQRLLESRTRRWDRRGLRELGFRGGRGLKENLLRESLLWKWLLDEGWTPLSLLNLQLWGRGHRCRPKLL